MFNSHSATDSISDRRSWLEQILFWGLPLVILLAPTQKSVDIGGMYISLVDPLIWGLFGVWLIRLGQTGKWPAVGLPLPALLLMVWAVVSGLTADNKLKAAKDIIQFAEYFLVAYLLFACHAESGAERQWQALVWVFLGSATVVILYGLWQYFTPAVDDFMVRATFGNRNVFGGFLALTLPLFYGLLLFDPPWRRKLWYAGALLAGIMVTLSGGTMLGLLLGLGLVSIFKSTRTFLLFLLVSGLLLGAGLSVLPRHNADSLVNSVALFNAEGAPTRRYPEWQAAVSMIQDLPWFGAGTGNYQEKVGEYFGILPGIAEKAEADSQNLYLVIGGAMGLPALLAFIGLLLFFLRQALASFFTSDEAFTRGLALGLAGSLAAFAVNGLWAPLVVRGIGVPLVLVFSLASACGRTARTVHDT